VQYFSKSNFKDEVNAIKLDEQNLLTSSNNIAAENLESSTTINIAVPEQNFGTRSVASKIRSHQQEKNHQNDEEFISPGT